MLDIHLVGGMRGIEKTGHSNEDHNCNQQAAFQPKLTHLRHPPDSGIDEGIDAV